MGYFESGRFGKSVPEIDVQQRELLEMIVESVDRFLADQQDNFGDWVRALIRRMYEAYPLWRVSEPHDNRRRASFEASCRILRRLLQSRTNTPVADEGCS